jgi:hypothetical protein
MTTYWQIAAGSNGRDYSKVFLKFGIMFVGYGTRIESIQEIQVGDIVVLKQGKSFILAAGTVIQKNGAHNGLGDKKWLHDFDGWDLEAYCYVEWKQPSSPVATTGLNRPAIQRLYVQAPRDIADDILKNGIIVISAPEPKPVKPVEDRELLKFLITQGFRASSADELTNTISKIRLLAEYYYDRWDDILEHETRTFLVIPLLLALGWSEQQIKIELGCSNGKIDIACFRKNYDRKNNDCLVLIETKSFLSGLDYAHNQAIAYSNDFPNCQTLVVTNGYCYKIYLRDDTGQFSYSPSAYLNLLFPRDKYPIDPENVGGAFDVIKSLLPSFI